MSGLFATEPYVAPRNPTEAKLADIWMEAFGGDRVGVHDNFFSRGGHSLLATQVVARISDVFRTELSLRHLFQNPTIAGLESVIAQPQGTGDIRTERVENSYPSVVVRIQEGQGGPPLFCIHPAGGQVMDYRALAAAIDPDRLVYGLQSRALADAALEHTSVDEMAIEYAAAIRQRQPAGPYYMLGWSMGGVVAVSVARLLEEQGERVAFIGLVDSYLMSENVGAYGHDPIAELAPLLGGVLADVFVGLDGAEQADIRARLSTLSLDEKIREALALGRQRGLLSADLSIELARRQIALVNAHQRLLSEHQPRAVRAPLFLWWAQERSDGATPRTDWELYTTGRTQSEMTGGNHFTCLRPPNVQRLAERIRKRMTEIEGPTSSGAAIE